jgi:hypothetical protein
MRQQILFLEHHVRKNLEEGNFGVTQYPFIRPAEVTSVSLIVFWYLEYSDIFPDLTIIHTCLCMEGLLVSEPSTPGSYLSSGFSCNVTFSRRPSLTILILKVLHCVTSHYLLLFSPSVFFLS